MFFKFTISCASWQSSEIATPCLRRGRNDSKKGLQWQLVAISLQLSAISLQLSAISSQRLAADCWLLTASHARTKIPRPKYQHQNAKVKSKSTTQSARILPVLHVDCYVFCSVVLHFPPFSISDLEFLTLCHPHRGRDLKRGVSPLSYLYSPFP